MPIKLLDLSLRSILMPSASLFLIFVPIFLVGYKLILGHFTTVWLSEFLLRGLWVHLIGPKVSLCTPNKITFLYVSTIQCTFYIWHARLHLRLLDFATNRSLACSYADDNSSGRISHFNHAFDETTSTDLQLHSCRQTGVTTFETGFFCHPF